VLNRKGGWRFLTLRLAHVQCWKLVHYVANLVTWQVEICICRCFMMCWLFCAHHAALEPPRRLVCSSPPCSYLGAPVSCSHYFQYTWWITVLHFFVWALIAAYLLMGILHKTRVALVGLLAVVTVLLMDTGRGLRRRPWDACLLLISADELCLACLHSRRFSRVYERDGGG
jgi:hypothetical protein